MQILFLWVGIPLVAVGALVILSEARARRGTVAVSGRLVGFSRLKDDADESYHVVAEYDGVDGRSRLIESAVGSAVPLGRVGDVVQVLYDPGDPRTARIDRGLWNRAIPVLVGALGALLALCGLWMRPRRSDRVLAPSSG